MSLSLCGNLVLPEFYGAGTGQANTLHPLLGAGIVLATCLASLILFSFLFAGISVNEKRAAVYFKGILLLLLLEFAAMLVVSALYGLIAVLIQGNKAKRTGYGLTANTKILSFINSKTRVTTS